MREIAEVHHTFRNGRGEVEGGRVPLPSKVYSKNKYSPETLIFSGINTLTLELKARVVNQKCTCPAAPPKKKTHTHSQLHFRDFSAMDRYARIFDGQDHFKSARLGFNHIITSVHQGGRGKGRHPPTHHGRLKAQIPVVTMFSIPGTRLTKTQKKGGHVMPRYRVGKLGIDSHLCFPPQKKSTPSK